MQIEEGAIGRGLFCKSLISEIDILNKDYYYYYYYYNALRDLHNSLYPTKAEFINCFIIHSK